VSLVVAAHKNTVSYKNNKRKLTYDGHLLENVWFFSCGQEGKCEFVAYYADSFGRRPDQYTGGSTLKGDRDIDFSLYRINERIHFQIFLMMWLCHIQG
jgi:hypothetical protein